MTNPLLLLGESLHFLLIFRAVVVEGQFLFAALEPAVPLSRGFHTFLSALPFILELFLLLLVFCCLGDLISWGSRIHLQLFMRLSPPLSCFLSAHLLDGVELFLPSSNVPDCKGFKTFILSQKKKNLKLMWETMGEVKRG